MNPQDLELKRQKARAAGYTDLEIANFEKQNNIIPSSSGFIEKTAPNIGSILGGFAGPVGTGTGYAMGKTAQSVMEQTRGLQDIGANWGDVAKYGAQNPSEVGKNIANSGLLQSLLGMTPFGTPTNVMNKVTGQQPTEVDKFLKESVGGGIGMAAFDKLINAAISPVQGLVFGKAGKVGLGTPKAIQKGLEETKGQLGSEINQVMAKEGATKLPIQDVLDNLLKIKQDASKSGAKEAVTRVDKMISRLTNSLEVPKTLEDSWSRALRLTETKPLSKISSIPSMSLENLWARKGGFQSDIFGEAGKELTTRGVGGSFQKKAEKVAADQIMNKLTNYFTQAGYKDMPKVLEKYGATSNLSKTLDQPFKNFFYGSILTSLLSQIPGVGAAALPIGSAVTAYSMPYTRLLMSQLLGRGLNVIPTVGRGILPSYLNQGNQEGK
jgi:hypothetical protein